MAYPADPVGSGRGRGQRRAITMFAITASRAWNVFRSVLLLLLKSKSESGFSMIRKEKFPIL